MLNRNDFLLSLSRSDRLLTFTHPDEVLHDQELSLEDKRAILAAWASDSHAVPNLPAMRQLESGSIVSVDVVLHALQALDGERRDQSPRVARPLVWGRPRLSLRPTWRRSRRRDDDDDPPPCPAAAFPPGVEEAWRRRREAFQAAAA